jgi:hypothetical protein
MVSFRLKSLVPPNPAAFWTWFAKNRSRAEGIIDCQLGGDTTYDHAMVEPVISAFYEALQKFDRRLACEFGPLDDGYDFVISAEGDASAFDRVFALVKAAPDFPRWRITALKPRSPHGYVALDGIPIRSDQLTYVALKADDDPSKADFVFAADIDVAAYEEPLQYMAHLALDAALGEHDAAKLVNSVTVISKADFVETFGEEGDPLSELQIQFPPSQTMQ